MKQVTCDNAECFNYGVTIAVPSGPEVTCGPCGTILAEQDATYVVPEPESKVETVREILSTFTDEEWAALRNG